MTTFSSHLCLYLNQVRQRIPHSLKTRIAIACFSLTPLNAIAHTAVIGCPI
ncbi:MAG: hypothetical protein LDL41_13210 [Coleofasciculus sp. S288]|nr:hypothetical protein [Coleofasciculus sp. S288]